MKKFEGTKGKFEVELNGYYPDVRLSGRDNDKVITSSVMLLRLITNKSGVSEFINDSLCEENIANAKMFAAAPELLELAFSTYNFLRKTGIRFLFPKFFKKLKESLEKALN